MANKTFYRASGAWRDSKPFPHAGGARRTPIASWYKSGGVWRQVYTAAAIVNPFPAVVLLDEQSPPTNPFAALTVYPNGSLGFDGLGSGASGSAWYAPPGGTPGAAHWIRFVRESGTIWSLGGLSNNTLYALSAARTIGWQRETDGETTCSFGVYIYSDAGGSTLVSSRTGNTLRVYRGTPM